MTCTAPLAQRVERGDDDVSVVELAGRVRGLLALHRRALAAQHELLARAAVATDATARHQLAQEARAAADCAEGAADEADRLRGLAGLLRRLGAAW